MSCKAGPVNNSKERIAQRAAGPGAHIGKLSGEQVNRDLKAVPAVMAGGCFNSMTWKKQVLYLENEFFQPSA